MSIWDKLTGRKSSSSTASSSASPTTNPPSDAFQPTPFDPQEAQDVSSFLTGASFADPSQLHPLAGLNQQTLDYLSLEDSALSDLPGSQSALPSRGWSDDLCYGTGVTYLTALTVGGAWGLQEGLRRSHNQPPKLRLNSVLNAVTRRGPFLGNSAGVIAMVYNGFNSFIGHMRGKTRFCEQYCGRCCEWNDLQEYEGGSTYDDLRRNRGYSGRCMGCEFDIVEVSLIY